MYMLCRLSSLYFSVSWEAGRNIYAVIFALYHAWLTLHDRLTSRLSTRPPGPISLQTSPLYCS